MRADVLKNGAAMTVLLSRKCTKREVLRENDAEATVDVTTAAKSYIIVLTETARTERKAI